MIGAGLGDGIEVPAPMPLRFTLSHRGTQALLLCAIAVVLAAPGALLILSVIGVLVLMATPNTPSSLGKWGFRGAGFRLRGCRPRHLLSDADRSTGGVASRKCLATDGPRP